jgi:hypothetical protein
LILKTKGPQPSFTELSIFSPIDVNANNQLPSNLAREANGSGRGLYEGMTTFPPLQQLL